MQNYNKPFINVREQFANFCEEQSNRNFDDVVRIIWLETSPKYFQKEYDIKISRIITHLYWQSHSKDIIDYVKYRVKDQEIFFDMYNCYKKDIVEDYIRRNHDQIIKVIA